MDYCYVKFKSMNLLDKINYFKKRFGSFEKTSENYIYYKDLLDEIMLKLYRLSLEISYIGKENATEVIVCVLDCLTELINRCNASSERELNQFFFNVLFNTYRNISKQKNKSTARENIIITFHVAYENHLQSIELQENEFRKSENTGIFEAEDSVSLKKMKYVFANRPINRYRFFVFFLTQCRSMSETMIETVCNQFNFNYNQTICIIKTAKKIAGTDCFKRYKMDKFRRNTGWTRLLVAESSQVTYGYQGNSEKSKQYSEIVSKRKAAHIQRNINLHKPCLISPLIISELLNIARSTVYCHISASKALLKWCLDISQYNEELNLSPKMVKMVETGQYINEIDKINLPEFNPFEEFSISLA